MTKTFLVTVRKIVGPVRADGLRLVEICGDIFGKVIGKNPEIKPVKVEKKAGVTLSTFNYDGVDFYSIYTYKDGSKFLMADSDVQERLALEDSGFSVDISDILSSETAI